MDSWGFEHLERWLEHRIALPVGPLFCVIEGPTRGRPWSASAVRAQLRRLAVQAGVRRRFAPHQLRHAHAVELAREGVAINVIQRQLGHSDLGVTSVYLQGIDTSEIVDALHARQAPVMPASAGLRLGRDTARGGAVGRALRAERQCRPGLRPEAREGLRGPRGHVRLLGSPKEQRLLALSEPP